MVIGNPINHSKSPDIHQAFAKQAGLEICYHRKLCPVDFDSFEAEVTAFFKGGGVGANVTLPFKEWAYQLCQNNVSSLALSAQAVNTLSIKNGQLFGDNTDGIGLVADLQANGICLQGKKVAIIGAGGATRGVILPLLQAEASVSVYNRTAHKAYALAKEFGIDAGGLTQLTGHFDLIINATSATVHGQTLALTHSDCDVAYDMMYGKFSPFLAYFNHAKTLDGLGMLIQQAKSSFELWTNHQINLKALNFDFLRFDDSV